MTRNPPTPRAYAFGEEAFLTMIARLDQGGILRVLPLRCGPDAANPGALTLPLLAQLCRPPVAPSHWAADFLPLPALVGLPDDADLLLVEITDTPALSLHGVPICPARLEQRLAHLFDDPQIAAIILRHARHGTPASLRSALSHQIPPEAHPSETEYELLDGLRDTTLLENQLHTQLARDFEQIAQYPQIRLAFGPALPARLRTALGHLAETYAIPHLEWDEKAGFRPNAAWSAPGQQKKA